MKKFTAQLLIFTMIVCPLFAGCANYKLVMVHKSVFDAIEVTRKNNEQLAREALKRYDWHYERLVDNVDVLVQYFHDTGKNPNATVEGTLDVLKEEREQFVASLQLAVENEANLVEIRDALGYEAGANNNNAIITSLGAIAVALGIALAAS